MLSWCFNKSIRRISLRQIHMTSDKSSGDVFWVFCNSCAISDMPFNCPDWGGEVEGGREGGRELGGGAGGKGDAFVEPLIVKFSSIGRWLWSNRVRLCFEPEQYYVTLHPAQCTVHTSLGTLHTVHIEISKVLNLIKCAIAATSGCVKMSGFHKYLGIEHLSFASSRFIGHTIKTRQGSPVGSRPSPMDLHH